ncbi:MAG: HAMP domain-containing sensor histidine kinase [Actinomycetota bacterium]
MTVVAGTKKSLRRRLFGSHLLVMVVALLVLAIVVGFLALASDGRGGGPGRQESTGPSGALLGLSAAATASGLVSWRMARRLAAPLEGVGAATRQLAAGRYDVRLPEADTAELDALVADVNRLADELATTEQRRLRLIGDVAHELRNPLSTIEGTMEALLDGVIAADDETFARIGREAARLRRLADDLSSLSAAGELGVLDHQVVDLVAVATDVVAQLEPQATAKGLTVTVTTTLDPTAASAGDVGADGAQGTVSGGAQGTVQGDRDRLTQVLTNVVGNAVQYTDRGGVDVRVLPGRQRHGGGTSGVTIEVVDTGRGLAAEDQVRIFDRFHRVDDRFTDGTGVGLAIAKLLVEANGGTITASSDGLGHGTTIRIDLPGAVDRRTGTPTSRPERPTSPDDQEGR